jgi:cyclopropane fatty-acyl-phospholipid synthase-like methyltransferase
MNDLIELLSSEVYQHNLKFWEKAWSGVKAPYKQLPDLPYLERIPNLLEKNGARHVLDLGCGSGWLAIFLARYGFEVTGIDISPHAIDLAKNWATEEGFKITFDAYDIADIPYPPNSFDGVVANSIFEHFTFDMAKITIDRLKKILLPGGTFIGCFDRVGTGPGEYYELSDGTHVYTDKGRQGMMLRYFEDKELKELFADWQIEVLDTLESGSRFVCAHS